MKIKVIFFNSGDEIEFEAVNAELSEYYIDSLNRDNCNNFSIQTNECVVLYDTLKKTIEEVNSFIKYFIDFTFTNESLDQRVLNKIHCDWAKLQKERINVKNLNNQYSHQLLHLLPDDGMEIPIFYALQLIGKCETYVNINTVIHLLENSFFIEASTSKWYQIENKFSKSCLSMSPSQLILPFHHLGRTLYNKFLFRDDKLEFDDENSYDELVGFVTINFSRYQTTNFSEEYKKWCFKNNRTPIGNWLNIGKLPDLEDRLTYYRQLIFNNVKMQNNFFIEQR